MDYSNSSAMLLAIGGAKRVEQLQPVTITVPTAVAISGLGKSTIWGLLASGTIKSGKAGRRRLVYVDSLREYLAALPPAEGLNRD